MHAVAPKLRPPRLPKVVGRTRLFRLLDAQFKERPIVWVAGPPGAGKTTLAASYLAARKRPAVWYRVDEEDGDPATLAHYLGLAAQQATRSKRSFPRLMPEQRTRFAAFARDFFAELFERIGRRTLVLDNFQLLPEASLTHDLLTAGLAEIPSGAAVFVLSRREPPPSFTSLAASRSIGRLDPGALNLSLEEAAALARLWRRRGRKRLSRREVAALFEKTRGWMAGLILLLEQNADLQAEYPESTGQPPELVFDYLARELVGGFTSQEQEFLTRVAVLPTMRARTAEDLTGHRAASRFLERLHRGRTFTERKAHAEAVYQFHPLFRDFLLGRFDATVPLEEQRRLRNKAATLLARDGAFEEALALYQDSGDAESAAQLILQHAPALLNQGRHETVEQAIRKLPGDLVSPSPELQYTLAVAMGPARPEEVGGLLERARFLFQERGDRKGALRTLTHQIFAVIFSWKDLRPLDQLIDAAETLLPTLLAGPLDDPEHVVTAAQWMQAIAFRRPWDNRVSELMTRVTRAINVISDPDAIAFAASQVAYLRIWYGDVALARDVVQTARQRCLGKSISLMPRWMLSLAEAIWAWNAGDGRRCIDILRPSALDAGKMRFVYSADVVGPGQLICGALLIGDLDLACQAVDVMLPAFEKTASVTGNTYQAHAAWVALETGNRETAERHVIASLKAAPLCGPFADAHGRIVAAWLAHEQGDTADADRHLSIAREIAEHIKSSSIGFPCRLIASGFALDRGERRRAVEALAEALAIGRSCGLCFGFGLRRATMSRLLALALEEGIEEPYVLDMIHRLRLAPPEPADAVVDWPRRLSIQTLGTFAVRQDGAPLRFSRKAQRRPLALLQALIAFGGRKVAPDRLADALWPDAEGDAARQALATTLHRLRRLLGCDEAIEVVDGQLTLCARDCAVDAWAFETLAARAEAAAEPDQASRATERALTLYRGAFLPGEMNAAWAVTTRERLRARHAKLLLNAVERWRKQSAFDTARSALERAIEIEPGEERFCRELMAEYWRLGRAADAQAAFEHFRRTTRAVSGDDVPAEWRRVR